MAKTVGYPCAIATKMVLDGEIQKPGMLLPFTGDIYRWVIFVLITTQSTILYSDMFDRPILQRLRAENIIATEKSTFIM